MKAILSGATAVALLGLATTARANDSYCDAYDITCHPGGLCEVCPAGSKNPLDCTWESEAVLDLILPDCFRWVPDSAELDVPLQPSTRLSVPDTRLPSFQMPTPTPAPLSTNPPGSYGG